MEKTLKFSGPELYVNELTLHIDQVKKWQVVCWIYLRKANSMETNELKNLSSDPKETPAPVPGLKKLDVFVGTWHVEGEAYDQEVPGDPGATAKWVSDETYEWLPGGFFLVHRWDARVGAQEFTGIEVIGYDDATDTYFSQLFDNLGNRLEYSVKSEADTWIFTGLKTRATVRERIDGSTMEWNWEGKTEGQDWQPICDRVATRLR